MKIPNEIYVSQEDLEDNLNIEGEVNTALLFSRPIEGVQTSRYANIEAKWHKVTIESRIPHCDRYNEVILIAFGAHKEENTVFSATKVCYWKIHNDRCILKFDIEGLSNAAEFGEIYWASIKDFFPKFNK